MSVLFIKMQSLGNDFVIIDQRINSYPISYSQKIKLADRRQGIGCDQLILLIDPKNLHADVALEIFNADGSKALMCANGLRCVAAFLFSTLNKKNITIEIEENLYNAISETSGNVKLSLGMPKFLWHEIPLKEEINTANAPLIAGDLSNPFIVSVGNPHTVFFVDDFSDLNLQTIGAFVEQHPLFPEKTNVEFVKILSEKDLLVRVWERGVGMTLSCGSGAAATAIAAHKRGYCGPKIEVHFEIGSLLIEIEEKGEVSVIGPTHFCFKGELYPQVLEEK